MTLIYELLTGGFAGALSRTLTAPFELTKILKNDYSLELFFDDIKAMKKIRNMLSHPVANKNIIKSQVLSVKRFHAHSSAVNRFFSQNYFPCPN